MAGRKTSVSGESAASTRTKRMQAGKGTAMILLAIEDVTNVPGDVPEGRPGRSREKEI